MNDTHHDIAADLAAYANGSLDADRRRAVQAHVERCGACAADLDAWDAITAGVRADAQAIADRRDRTRAGDAVLANVFAAIDADQRKAEDRDDATVTPLTPRAQRRRSWPRVVAIRVAAAIVAALVLVTVLPEEGVDSQQLLLAAATRTSQARTATITVTGTSTIAVGATRPDEPAATTIDAEVAGAGQVRFGQRSRVRLTVTTPQTGPGGRVDIVTVGADRYIRTDDGAWTRSSADTAGTAGAALLTPHTPTVLLQSADGPIDDLGAETIDGTTVRHLRFDVAAGALPDPAGVTLTHRADVWIDDDGLLRRFTLHAQGPATDPVPAYWQVELTVDLHDFGAPVDIHRPAMARDRQREANP